MNRTSQGWRSTNPDRQVHYNENREKRESKAGNGYENKDIQNIRAALGDRCAYCGERLNGEWVVDHIIPLKQGGSHSAKNITLACKKCNGDKHSKTPTEYVLWRKKRGLTVRKGMNWSKFQLPASDDGLKSLIAVILDVQERNSIQFEKVIVKNLESLRPRILKLISTLTKGEESILRMRYGLGVQRVTTLGLISEKIGASHTTVSGTLARAKLKLQQHPDAKRLIQTLKR